VTCGQEESGNSFGSTESGTESARGIFFSTEELSVIFPFIKKNEAHLDLSGRQILTRIERIMYNHLSIEDIENRLRGSGGYG
jgi:hypothetical protein